MTDSPSSRILLRLMQSGTQTNVWGDLLDAALQLVDDAIAGITTIALTGDHTLVRANFVTDEARSAGFKFTGSVACTITIPSITKIYLVWNASSATQTLTTGSGTTAAVLAGEIALVVSDSVNVQRVVARDFAGQQLTNVADPTSPQSAATKAYVDATAFAMDSGVLPGQVGSSGKFLKTVANAAGWASVMTADIPDYITQTKKRALLAALIF